jgi:hypothetical protein
MMVLNSPMALQRIAFTAFICHVQPVLLFPMCVVTE